MIPVVHSMRDTSKSRVVRLIKYVSNDNGKPDRIGEVFITNCASPDPFIVSREMEAVQHLNTRSEDDKTYHLTVSFPNGERPESEQIRKIEEAIADALGYGEFQRITVVHNDTDNTHMHMVINKIHPAKNTIRTVLNDHVILAKVCAELEKELSLAVDNHEAEKSHAEARIDNLEHKRGVESFAAYARNHAEAALEASKTWAEFHERLSSAGILAQLRGNGLIFASHTGEYAAKGSSLGRGYSKANLEKVLGDFEPPAGKIQLLNFQSAYEEKAAYGDKTLYEEYKTGRDEAAKEREQRLGTLNEERGRAIEEAKREAVERVGSETFANIFRSQRLKQILIRQTENRLVGEIRETFEEKREEVRQAARQNFADWLRDKAAAAGDERAVLSLQNRETSGRKGEEASSRNLEGEKIQSLNFSGGRENTITSGKESGYDDNSEKKPFRGREEGEDRAREGRKIQLLNFSGRPGKGEAFGKQGVYAEYREFLDREQEAKASERAGRLENLRKEQSEAIERAKFAARKKIEEQPENLLRSKRLTAILQRQEARKATEQIRRRFRETRREICRVTRRTGYVAWLKREAVAGNVRAIYTLRAKGEVAPGLIFISSREMKNAKVVASKIEGVTGRGTLFYKAGNDVYRDDGRNISLKEGITDAGIKNALIIAGVKFNAPLTLDGTDEFKMRCAGIARREGLKITFDNPALEAERQRQAPRSGGKTAGEGRRDGREATARERKDEPRKDSPDERKQQDRKNKGLNL